MKCKCNEDELLRDLIYSTSSNVDISVHETHPTVISLQDTITLIERKYGKDWMYYPECKAIVIWASSNFLLEHVKEVVPELFDLCKEYHEKRTVNGKEFPEKFLYVSFLYDRSEY
jgi:hypothetical protein